MEPRQPETTERPPDAGSTDASGSGAAPAPIGGASATSPARTADRDRSGRSLTGVLTAFGAPSPLVAEIKERLSEISRREAAVKLRETELESQYRLMQQFVRDEAERELNEARARLAARSDELDGQALELSRRRSELDSRADGLANEQARLDADARRLADAERALGAARQDLSEAATREIDQRERDRRSLLNRIDIIRNREQDLERRIARARDEIVRQRATLNEEQTAHQRAAAALATRRAEVEAELKALRARHDEDFRRQRADVAADLERQQADVAARLKQLREDTAAELHAQRRQLATEVKEQRTALASETQTRRVQLAAEAEAQRARIAAESAARRAADAAELQRQQDQLDIDLRERREELAALNAEYAEKLGALEAAAVVVHSGRAALAAERVDVDERRAALAKADAELIAARGVLEQRRRELEDFDRNTAESRARLLRELDAITARRDTLAREAADHERRAAELEQRDGQLRQRGDELRREAEGLAARTAEQARQQRAAEAALEKQRRTVTAELEKRRRTTEAELEKRRQAIEASLKEQRAAAQREVDAWRARVEREVTERQESAEREIASRLTRIAERDERTAVLEEDLLRLRDEAALIRDQAEARDAETRQAALAAELDRQQLERERVLLDAAHADVMQLREQRDADVLAARAALRAKAEQLRLAERTRLAAPRLWWLRATTLAAAAGVAAAVAWWRWDAPAYRAETRITVQTAAQDTNRAAAQHAAAILSRGVLGEAPGGLGAAWDAALTEGRVAGRASGADVLLSVEDGDGARAGRLARAAADAYAAAVNAVEPTPALPSTYDDLVTRRASVAAELEPLRASRAELAMLLAGLPPAAERERRLDESLALREQQRAATAELARRRAELNALLAGANPRGVLDEATFAQACAADDVLREDEAEFARQAQRYQQELGAAMSAPAKALEAYGLALGAYAAAVRAQHEHQPTPAASAVLEEAAADVEERQAAIAAFGAAWRARRNAVGAVAAETETSRLLEQQAGAAEAARALAEGGRAFLKAQEARVAGLLNSTDGGTRAAVLANNVRAALADLGDAQREAERAAARVELSGNVELDALGRQLRGLRTQITYRQETLRQDMQLAADRAAQADYDGSLAEVRAAVERLEAARETGLGRLTDTLDALRGLENIVLERRRLEDRIAFADRSIAGLAAQLGQLDVMLDEARRSGPTPDRVTVAGGPSLRQVTGLDRERNTLLSGGAAFAAVWVACALMLMRNPLARRKADAEDDFELPLGGLRPGVEPR